MDGIQQAADLAISLRIQHKSLDAYDWPQLRWKRIAFRFGHFWIWNFAKYRDEFHCDTKPFHMNFLIE